MKNRFKAWDLFLHKWYEDSEYLMVCHDKIFFKYDGEAWKISNSNCVFVQFTGLHDKNGKEIYEGDRYQVAGNKAYIVRFLNGISNHEFYGGMFGLWESEELFFPFDEYALKTGVIIGNIHDNPELIA